MRILAVALAALALFGAGAARASYTIDLIWSDTGTPTLTIWPPGHWAAPAGTSNPCVAGRLFDGGPGRCLEIHLRAAEPFTSALVTVGWDAEDSRLELDHLGRRSFGQWGGVFPGGQPTHLSVASTSGCVLYCDTAWGSFGGVSVSPIAAGSYLIGSIHFDTSDVILAHSILGFLRTGVDGVADKQFNAAPVQVNDAQLFAPGGIPEPGTAGLLGLGLLGLTLVVRRRRPPR